MFANFEISAFRIGALVLCSFCFVALASDQGNAQQASTPKERIEIWDRTASEVEKALEGVESVEAERLETLRENLIGQRAEALELRDELQRTLAPLRDQLAALGPIPEEAAARDREVEARRKQLLSQVSALEAREKEVGLVLARAAALEEQLARRQRLQFTDLLFTRGVGPFDAAAWSDFNSDIPELSSKVGAFLGGAFGAFDAFGAHVLITLAICLSGVIAILSWRSVLGVADFLAHAAVKQASAGRKALYTALEFALRAGPAPLIAAFVVIVTLKTASPGETGAFVLTRIAETVALLSALAVLTLLALRGRSSLEPEAPPPNRSRWLLFGVSGLAIVFALDWLALDFLEQAGASLGTLSIANGAVAALAAASLLSIASRLTTPDTSAETVEQPILTGLDDDDELSASFDMRGVAIVTLRTALISAALILIVAALAGFYALTRYVLTGVTMTSLLVGAATVFYFAFTLADRQQEAEASGGAPSVDAAARVSRPQNSFLIAALIVTALPLVALIWGVSGADLSSALLILFSDIKVGDAVISIQDIFWAVAVLMLGIWLTRLFQRFLRAAVLRSAGLAPGARAAIDAGIGYAGVLLALLLAISAAGVNLSNLAIIAGALSVGIGFGLQNVVSNFVSGLILLIERPIQPGDWIEVGGFSGYVKRINVRSTEITTFDRASVIVPNSELISASVVNWTHRSLVGRAIVRVGVGYDSDPDQVARILSETALAHENVLKTPAPWIVFADFGASSLDFEIRCYLRDINGKLGVESDLRFALLKRLKEEGIEIPFPQRVVEIKSDPKSGDAS